MSITLLRTWYRKKQIFLWKQFSTNSVAMRISADKPILRTAMKCKFLESMWIANRWSMLQPQMTYLNPLSESLFGPAVLHGDLQPLILALFSPIPVKQMGDYFFPSVSEFKYFLHLYSSNICTSNIGRPDMAQSNISRLMLGINLYIWGHSNHYLLPT